MNPKTPHAIVESHFLGFKTHLLLIIAVSIQPTGTTLDCRAMGEDLSGNLNGMIATISARSAVTIRSSFRRRRNGCTLESQGRASRSADAFLPTSAC
jgi:hypothetical protein